MLFVSLFPRREFYERAKNTKKEKKSRQKVRESNNDMKHSADNQRVITDDVETHTTTKTTTGIIISIIIMKAVI